MDLANVSPNDEKKAAVKFNIELFEGLVEEFNRLFPDRDSALEELKRRLGDKACKCSYCGDHLPDAPGKRKIVCDNCRERNWVTAHTPFRNMKKLVRAWLAAIWFRERGVVLTSPRFAAALKCSVSASQVILKKHGYAILKTMESGEEDKTMYVPTAEFLEIYLKRSQQTPRRQHPSTEQQQAELDSNDKENQSGREQTPANTEQALIEPPTEEPSDGTNTAGSLLSTLGKDEMDVLKLLDEKEPKPFEQLRIATSLEFSKLGYAMTILEIEGLVKRLPGDSYLRTAKKKKAAGATFGGTDFRKIIDGFIEHIKTFSHGISRKTVQLYFAIYWYYRHREQLPESWLSRTCLGYDAVPDRELLEFVSPLKIRYWKLDLSIASG